MTTLTREEAIKRIAYGLWEDEGRPEGRAKDHWQRARETYEGDSHAPREVQPGFTDSAPGQVPEMKPDPGPDLDEAPGGRFARQIADAPDESPDSGD